MEEEKKELVGKVTHYYGKIGVAVVDLEAPLAEGDEILIEGKTTSLRQKVESMQIEHKNIKRAKAGDSIGLKVNEKVKENDLIYKIVQ
ncbi:MAG: translation elongation factor-like protein [Candidatus Aenigmarchaeota archaeon]|nr:translation elongation factor-like protein [Candidatus Aenigmarchaeota archaeon]